MAQVSIINKQASTSTQSQSRINYVADRPSIIISNTKMELVNKNIADDLLAKAFEGQRPIVDRHVNYLTKCVALGEFNPFDPITILVDAHNPAKYGLVNGNHRMTMISRNDFSICMDVKRLHSVNFDEDFAWLYATFDKSKARSASDGLAIFGEHKKYNLTANQVNLIAKGAAIYKRDFANHACGVDYGSKSSIALHNLFEDHVDNGVKYFEDISGACKTKAKAMNTQDMIAVAIKLYEDNAQDQTKIRAFYSSVANGLFSSMGDAAKVLADGLVDPTWQKRPKENKRQVIEKMFDRWLAKEECERISPYRTPREIAEEKQQAEQRKARKNLTSEACFEIHGSNNTILL